MEIRQFIDDLLIIYSYIVTAVAFRTTLFFLPFYPMSVSFKTVDQSRIKKSQFRSKKSTNTTHTCDLLGQFHQQMFGANAKNASLTVLCKKLHRKGKDQQIISIINRASSFRN